MNNPHLTKICSVCGEQKPLTAFSQLSGSQGLIYGNICASCRKTAMDKLKSPADTEGSSTSKTGYKIDSKAKVQAEADKRLLRKEQEELNQEEKEKSEEMQSSTIEKRKTIASKEKDHRESLKKSSVFSSQPTGNKSGAPVFGGVEQTSKEGTIDLTTGPAGLDTGFVKVKRQQGDAFNRLVTLLGGSPIAQSARTIMQQKNAAAAAAANANKGEKPAAIAEKNIATEKTTTTEKNTATEKNVAVDKNIDAAKPTTISQQPVVTEKPVISERPILPEKFMAIPEKFLGVPKKPIVTPETSADIARKSWGPGSKR